MCVRLTSQLPAADLCWELRSCSAHPRSEVDSAAISLSLRKNATVNAGWGGHCEMCAGRHVFRVSPAHWKPGLKWSATPNFVRSRRRLRCAHGTHSLTSTPCAYVRVRVWRAMEENLQVAAMHVKSEAADESASALALGSQDSPAPCGDTACRGGRGGGVDQSAEELQPVTTSTPVLLCEYIFLIFLWRQVLLF